MRSLAVLNLLIIIMIVSCAYAMGSEFELGSESESESKGNWSVAGVAGSDDEESVEKKKKEKEKTKIRKLKSIKTVRELHLMLDCEGLSQEKLVPKVKPTVLIQYFENQPLGLPGFPMSFRKRIWEKIKDEDGKLYSTLVKCMISQITNNSGGVENEHVEKFLTYALKVEAEDSKKEEKQEEQPRGKKPKKRWKLCPPFCV